MKKVGIIGGGAMGSGIAQVAAVAGHPVVLFDIQTESLEKAKRGIQAGIDKLVEKNKISPEQGQTVMENIQFTSEEQELDSSFLIIEAIVEKLEVKQAVFEKLSNRLGPDVILATNTSSLSVTSIARECNHPERVLGLHFFNPAPLMPLVEIIPAIQTNLNLAHDMRQLMLAWGKVPVIAQDTPGFIVNRLARPYYSEALRILDEKLATPAEIDQSMRELGFKMGPFELMDLIGHDVNYAVTESVFTSFYFDPRFKPSISQKKLVEAGWLGRKTGRGFYSYPMETSAVAVGQELKLDIQNRILAMLINEACDSAYHGVASEEDLDLAMTKGVNYPKGLLQWGEDWGWKNAFDIMTTLFELYAEDRYRISIGLKNRLA